MGEEAFSVSVTWMTQKFLQLSRKTKKKTQLKQKFHRKLKARFQIHTAGTRMDASMQKYAKRHVCAFIEKEQRSRRSVSDCNQKNKRKENKHFRGKSGKKHKTTWKRESD